MPSSSSFSTPQGRTCLCVGILATLFLVVHYYLDDDNNNNVFRIRHWDPVNKEESIVYSNDVINLATSGRVFSADKTREFPPGGRMFRSTLISYQLVINYVLIRSAD